jgi:hypothetical protein
VPSLVKGLFGLEGLSDNADFGEVISSPLGLWQAKNWDPAGESLSSPEGRRRSSRKVTDNQSVLKGSTTSATP